jgi:protein-disulfide isomerase
MASSRKMIRPLGLNNVIRCLGLALLLVGCGDNEQISYKACPIPIGDSPRRGDDDAWVTIVEYSDYQCPYCRYAESTIAQVDEQHQGLRWVYKHFPLTQIHDYAEGAASAADCAHAQGKFWEMHDILMTGKAPALTDEALERDAKSIGLDMDEWSSCFKSDESIYRVMVDYNEGQAYGVAATPTFFINGYRMTGVYPVEDILDVIALAEDEAKDSGIPKAKYYDTLNARGCHD